MANKPYSVIYIKNQLGVISTYLLQSVSSMIFLKKYVEEVDLTKVENEKIRMQLEEVLAMMESFVPDIKNFHDQINNAFRALNEMKLGELEI